MHVSLWPCNRDSLRVGNTRPERFVARVVEILAKERERQGMSHERLAEAAGVHRSTVSRTERGLMSPTLRVVYAMAEVLKLDLSAVIADAERKPGTRGQ